MSCNLHRTFKLTLIERLSLANGVHGGLWGRRCEVGGFEERKLGRKGLHPEHLRNRKIANCLPQPQAPGPSSVTSLDASRSTPETLFPFSSSRSFWLLWSRSSCSPAHLRPLSPDSPDRARTFGLHLPSATTSDPPFLRATVSSTPTLSSGAWNGACLLRHSGTRPDDVVQSESRIQSGRYE